MYMPAATVPRTRITAATRKPRPGLRVGNFDAFIVVFAFSAG